MSRFTQHIFLGMGNGDKLRNFSISLTLTSTMTYLFENLTETRISDILDNQMFQNSVAATTNYVADEAGEIPAKPLY